MSHSPWAPHSQSFLGTPQSSSSSSSSSSTSKSTGGYYSGASQIDQDFWDQVMQDPAISDEYENAAFDNVNIYKEKHKYAFTRTHTLSYFQIAWLSSNTSLSRTASYS